MRIISYNVCKDCCFFMDDYDINGLCCKDNIYKQVRCNQSACRYFCSDEEDYEYNSGNDNCISPYDIEDTLDYEESYYED